MNLPSLLATIPHIINIDWLLIGLHALFHIYRLQWRTLFLLSFWCIWRIVYRVEFVLVHSVFLLLFKHVLIWIWGANVLLRQWVDILLGLIGDDDNVVFWEMCNIWVALIIIYWLNFWQLIYWFWLGLIIDWILFLPLLLYQLHIVDLLIGVWFLKCVQFSIPLQGALGIDLAGRSILELGQANLIAFIQFIKDNGGLRLVMLMLVKITMVYLFATYFLSWYNHFLHVFEFFLFVQLQLLLLGQHTALSI